MSHSVIAKATPCPESNANAQAHAADTCLLELCKLIKLRDALIVLKGPLANSPEVRSIMEQRLLNNDVYERVLGTLASDWPPPIASIIKNNAVNKHYYAFVDCLFSVQTAPVPPPNEGTFSRACR